MERENFRDVPQGKILRAPNLKRGKLEERITDRIKLEKVLGVTVSSNAALSTDPHTETVAYPAGCTVVLLSTKNTHQTHIINSSKKTITSLAYSICGRYLVTGECGHQPAVRVWELQPENAGGAVQIAEFLGHKYGVSCVAFSPNTKYVVSIGTQHDMIVNLWDWRNNIKIASNKVSTKVKAVAFAENGSYFVTVGNRHVKFWYLDHGRAKYKEAVPLMGRSAILGEQRNNYFCDVACGKGNCGDSTYAITRSGLLCEFNNRRLLDKWVELRTTSANCMSIGMNYIFVGCADGIVRCFDPSSLRFVTTLPRTHYLGVDVSQGLSINHMSAQPPNARYPDAIAVTYDELNSKLTVVYNDHSVYVWAVKDVKRVGKSHSFLYHSACIWGVEIPSSPHTFSSPLPPNCFLTCSSDDTIRVWNLDQISNSQNSTPSFQSENTTYQRNIYSNELLKIVYVDPELNYLKDLDLSASGTEKDAGYDSRNGVRSIRLSPDSKHLASGDRAGNIRIHETSKMTEICKVEAHDAEVLCLEYSNLDSEQKLLASASRDRLIHVFDVNQGYNFLQTLDDHSSSITAVRFLSPQNNLQMVSCGADKSIIFRQLTGTPNGSPQFSRGHNASGKATLYDMEVDTGQKHVLTACQDRNVRVYSVQSGKHTKTFKGSTSDDGSLIKVSLDRSGIYLATSCTDKTLSVLDYYTGECLATMFGHSELATGLRFTSDCRRLISASGDGCIFVWRLPEDMLVTMQARLSQQALKQGRIEEEIDYRFNVSALPLWAKKQITDDTSPPISLTRSVDFPKGRWAQRAEKSMSVKSVYTDSVINLPSLQDRRADSDGSKDSSIDSGTESRAESRTYSESRTESINIAKVKTEFEVCEKSFDEFMQNLNESSSSALTSRVTTRRPMTQDSTLGSLSGSLRDPEDLESAHDGDIEDISDHESRQQPLYFTSQQDSASGSEFPVNAMDVEELRRSQKKAKRPNLPLVAVTTSVSGSQDSDDDDDEASTPSGENTDRNPMSMFSVSSESLDQIVNREKYLQSTFESMSGSEMEATIGKTSISSQHHTRLSITPVQLRNVAVINAAKQVKSDPEASRKREELNKRIEETRRKLQSVGYRSNLKSSQSITDLSNIPEKDWHTPKYPQQGITTTSNIQFDIPSTQKPQNSSSLPSNLQLCGCYLKDFHKNISNEPSKPKFGYGKVRGLNLPETGCKILHKSLPVSPVKEEMDFSNFGAENRKSFSYFLDLDSKISKVCSDIQKFSEYYKDKSDEEFSSDSLEDLSSKKKFLPRRCFSNNEIYTNEHQNYEIPKSKTSFYLNPSAKSSRESILSEKSCFNSLESVLTDDSECKSAPLEILFVNHRKKTLSNTSSPVKMSNSSSYPLNFPSNSIYNQECNQNYFPSSYVQDQNYFPNSSYVENTQNYFASTVVKPANLNLAPDKTTEKTVMPTHEKQFAEHYFNRNFVEITENIENLSPKKKYVTSVDFQQKLLKFENLVKKNETVKRQSVAYFIQTDEKMDIPTLKTKNLQYKSKFCNVLNNKPEINSEKLFSQPSNSKHNLQNMSYKSNEQKKSNTLQNVKDKPLKVLETTSLDRHILAKGLWDTEKISHKPPKPIRRNSSKYNSKKRRQFQKNINFDRNITELTQKQNKTEEKYEESVIELSYKEKNKEFDLENENKTILSDIYCSLDELLQDNVINKTKEEKLHFLSKSSSVLELEQKNVYKFDIFDKKPTKKSTISTDFEKIQTSIENIKILHDIQEKIHKINILVDTYKQNMTKGKVKKLSKMYDTLSKSQFGLNNLTQMSTLTLKRRNLSLPNFVERNLNFSSKNDLKMSKSVNEMSQDMTAEVSKRKNSTGSVEVKLPSESDSNLRRACSLSDLSLAGPPKPKIQVSGKLQKPTVPVRTNIIRSKTISITRSSSTGVLNQSDSDQDSPKTSVRTSLMRPTISSQNKVSNTKTNIVRRRIPQSISTMNLSSVGQEDSSSEETVPCSSGSKPTVPPRPRSMILDQTPMVVPRRHTAAQKEKLKANRLTLPLETSNKENDVNVKTAQISSQLCKEVAEQLTKAADNVQELYKRLTDPHELQENFNTSTQKTNLVKILENSVLKTQQILNDISADKQNGGHNNGLESPTDTVKKINELAKADFGQQDPSNVINFMNTYSDILLNMMQQKMANNK